MAIVEARRACALAMVGVLCVAAPQHGRAAKVSGPQILAPVDSHPLLKNVSLPNPDGLVASTRYGDITRRDMLLYLSMGATDADPAILWQVESRDAEDRSKAAAALRRAVEDYVFTQFWLPQQPEAIQSAAAQDDTLQAKRERVWALGAYQVAFLEHICRPEATPEQADRLKYMRDNAPRLLAPQRYRARVIFFKTSEADPALRRAAVELRMQTLRDRIAKGDISFETAARKFSDAPSASSGGMLPPFRKGELFYAFEDAVERLQPKQVSPVFPGPGGFYIAQNVGTVSPEAADLSDTKVSEAVDAELIPKAMRKTFEFELTDMLARRIPVDHAQDWDDRQLDERVGQVGPFIVTKRQFLALYPDIEANGLAIYPEVLARALRGMLQREALAQELELRKLTDSVEVVRGRQMAKNLALRDAYAASLRAGLSMEEKDVRAFFDRNPELFTPLPLVRVARVAVTAKDPEPDAVMLAAELDRVLADLRRGRKATSPAPPPFPGQIVPPGILEDQKFYGKDRLITASALELAQAIGLPKELVTSASAAVTPMAMTTGLDTPTTGLDLPVVDTTSTSTDRATTQPTNLLPDASTTGALHKLAPSSSATLSTVKNAQATSAGASGGAAPPQAEGGLTPQQAAKLEALRKRSLPKVSPTPATGVLPRLPAGVEVQQPLKLASKVTSYTSEVYNLEVQDLGWMYLEDRPDLPKELKKLPVGAICPTRRMKGALGAEAFQISEIRALPRPAFETSRARAYNLYRRAQVDAMLDAHRKAAVRAAGIRVFSGGRS